MFQIIFNEISAAEISQLDTRLQLELLTGFKVQPADLEHVDGDRFGRIERNGRVLHRYRVNDYRIYFEIVDGGVLVRRVLHKNTLQDFFYRSSLSMNEDEEVGRSKVFWRLIEEAEQAKTVQ
ncbi:MAG: mRNA-degrading endonuclease RelE of RelBE toxin-antitoxin system [Verrucomicrobiales bacterium]